MLFVMVVAGLLQAVARQDSARLVGSDIVVEPLGVSVALPPEWLGAKDTATGLLGCGHDVRGRLENRMAIGRPSLDSVLNATGEWDHEYSAVLDSTMAFSDLVAHVGPEPFGRDGHCFADLQLRVYVSKSDPHALAHSAEVRGLPTALLFFPSATIAARDSAEWHVEHLRWNAWYGDYGSEANVEIFSTAIGSRTLVLAFMHASRGDDCARRDQRFILSHLKLP